MKSMTDKSNSVFGRQGTETDKRILQQPTFAAAKIRNTNRIHVIADEMDAPFVWVNLAANLAEL